MTTKYLLLSAMAAGLALQAIPATAQTPAVGGTLEEVIVTARKRQESILKVPVIETAISQETLERYQISDITDLSSKVPGLSMGEAVLSIGPQISIRGVGTSTLDAGVDQSVALNVDGLSMTQGLAYKAGLFDLAQAEVLKGPQALFFGKNSPGGVIALRTADPGDKAEIIVRGAYETEAKEKHGELILSSPLTDTLGGRLAMSYSDADGFFHNRATPLLSTGAVAPVDRLPSTKSKIVRGTLVWKPTDVFDARLKVNWTKDETQGDAGQGQLVSCPDGKAPPSPGPGIPFINPNDNCKLDRNIYVVALSPTAFPGIRNGGQPFIDLTQKFGTLEMNYRPQSDVTLTSVTGYYRADSDSLINGTLTGFAATPIAADNHFNRHDFTQEFRADTEFASPVNFTAGAFYQDGQLFNRIRVEGNTFYTLPAMLVTGTHTIDIKSYSVFGQARWKPVTSLELAAGVRWTDEKRTDTPTDLITGTPVYVAPAVPEISAKNYSPELSVTYSLSDDMTLFGSLKQGYKSGSFTITTPVSQFGKPVNNSFGDEKVDGGEIGFKSRLLDHALSLNIASYYYVYKGLQVGTNEPSIGGIPIIRTINAGEAKIYGVDFDVAYRVQGLQGLTLNSAINWNHARFTDLSGVPCWGGQTILQGCNSVPNLARDPLTGKLLNADPATGLALNTAQGDLSGLALTRAPDWQLTAGAAYELPINDAIKMNFGADAEYTSKYPAALNDRADSIQKGYTLLNASISASSTNNSWEVALIGNNITNKITTGSCTVLNYANGQILGGEVTGGNGVKPGPAGIDENTCVARRGRELWLRVTFRPLSF